MKTIVPVSRKRTLTRQNGATRNSVHNSGKRTSAKGGTNTRLKSLLVPTDFSEAANRALNYAVPLADQFGGEIELIHVIERPADFQEVPPYVIDKRAVDKAKKDLFRLAEDRIGEWTPVNVDVLVGRAYQKICDEAKKLRSDLIVISTHGFTGLKHLLLGSTAERVVRHAPCSVLTVRGRGEAEDERGLRPKRILVPTDFSRSSTCALDYAAGLARGFRAEIVVLNVVPTHYPVGDYDLGAYSLLAADSKKIGAKRLAALVRTHAAKDVTLRAVLRAGRPATEIADAVKAENCDLIVISTHGRTGWNRVLLGSTAEEVVRHASCPVLVIRNKNSRVGK